MNSVTPGAGFLFLEDGEAFCCCLLPTAREEPNPVAMLTSPARPWSASDAARATAAAPEFPPPASRLKRYSSVNSTVTAAVLAVRARAAITALARTCMAIGMRVPVAPSAHANAPHEPVKVCNDRLSRVEDSR